MIRIRISLLYILAVLILTISAPLFAATGPYIDSVVPHASKTFSPGSLVEIDGIFFDLTATVARNC